MITRNSHQLQSRQRQLSCACAVKRLRPWYIDELVLIAKIATNSYLNTPNSTLSLCCCTGYFCTTIVVWTDAHWRSNWSSPVCCSKQSLNDVIFISFTDESLLILYTLKNPQNVRLYPTAIAEMKDVRAKCFFFAHTNDEWHWWCLSACRN